MLNDLSLTVSNLGSEDVAGAIFFIAIRGRGTNEEQRYVYYVAMLIASHWQLYHSKYYSSSWRMANAW